MGEDCELLPREEGFRPKAPYSLTTPKFQQTSLILIILGFSYMTKEKSMLSNYFHYQDLPDGSIAETPYNILKTGRTNP